MNKQDRPLILDDDKLTLHVVNANTVNQTLRLLINGAVSATLCGYTDLHRLLADVFSLNQYAMVCLDKNGFFSLDKDSMLVYQTELYYRPTTEVPVEITPFMVNGILDIVIRGQDMAFKRYQEFSKFGDVRLIENLREVLVDVHYLPESNERKLILDHLIAAQTALVESQRNHGAIEGMQDANSGLPVGQMKFFIGGKENKLLNNLFGAASPDLGFTTDGQERARFIVPEHLNILDPKNTHLRDIDPNSEVVKDLQGIDRVYSHVYDSKHTPIVPDLPVQETEAAAFGSGEISDSRSPSQVIFDEHVAQWYADHGLTPQAFDKSVTRFLKWQQSCEDKPIVQLDKTLFKVDIEFEQLFPDPTHPEYDGPAITHKTAVANPQRFVVYEDNYDASGDIQERLRAFETEVLQDALDFHFAGGGKYTGIQVERDGEETNDRIDIEGWQGFNKGSISDTWPQYVLYENITCIGSDEVDRRKELHRTPRAHMALSLMTVNGKVDGFFAEYENGQLVDIETKAKPIHEWIMMTAETAPKAVTLLTAQGLYIESVLPDQKYELTESDPWRWFVQEKDVEEPIVTEASMHYAIQTFFDTKPNEALMVHTNLNLLVWLARDPEDRKFKLHASYRPTTFESNDEFQKFVFDLPWVKKFRGYFTYA